MTKIQLPLDLIEVFQIFNEKIYFEDQNPKKKTIFASQNQKCVCGSKNGLIFELSRSYYVGEIDNF